MIQWTVCEAGLPQCTTPGTLFALFSEKGIPWSEVPRDPGRRPGRGLALTNPSPLTCSQKKALLALKKQSSSSTASQGGVKRCE